MNGIIALGNPGSQYQNTRHNAGYMAADAVCNALQGRWKKSFLRPFLFCEFPERNTVIIKPLTYMNRSGNIIPYVERRWAIQPENLLVLVDNLDLPCGRIRFKPKGSTAGHNGIKSIITAAGTPDFARMYLGIGRPGPELDHSQNPVVDHVLGAFTNQELSSFRSTLPTVIAGCTAWIDKGSVAATEIVNRQYAKSDSGN